MRLDDAIETGSQRGQANSNASAGQRGERRGGHERKREEAPANNAMAAAFAKLKR